MLKTKRIHQYSIALLCLTLVHRHCEARSNPMENLREIASCLAMTNSHKAMVSNMSEPRTKISFNQDWKFYLGDNTNAKQATFNDLKWRKLNLPHDWSIEGAFDEKNPAKPEGGGLPTGIGWYRKSFMMPTSVTQKVTYIEFDGVYKNSEVWINGKYLGKRPYGYISFRYELSKYLKPGKNVIAVRVDNSAQPDSRWYSGSGIYRNVWLVSTSKIAVEHWGTTVNASVNIKGGADGKDMGLVHVETRIKNKSGKQQQVSVSTAVYDFNNKLVEKIILTRLMSTPQEPA